MLSAFAAKAFTTTSRPTFARMSRLAMSTETSIVDQCRLKIQKALETENVKVTGKHGLVMAADILWVARVSLHVYYIVAPSHRRF
jgi:hypothetical protein